MTKIEAKAKAAKIWALAQSARKIGSLEEADTAERQLVTFCKANNIRHPGKPKKKKKAKGKSKKKVVINGPGGVPIWIFEGEQVTEEVEKLGSFFNILNEIAKFRR